MVSTVPVMLSVFGGRIEKAAGNPVVLCQIDALSDTTYLTRLAADYPGIDVCFYHLSDSLVDVRWFNGDNEIQFCGHAALALAWWLYSSNTRVSLFRSPTGSYAPVTDDDRIAIRVPIIRPSPASEMLSYFPNLPDAAINGFFEATSKTALVECGDAHSIEGWKPDFDQLLILDKEIVGALILFCHTDGQYDGYLRYFSPWYGKNEDIATGSAMRLLFPLLNDRHSHGDTDKNRGWLTIRQLSERGGLLKVRQYNEQEIIVTGHVSPLS